MTEKNQSRMGWDTHVYHTWESCFVVVFRNMSSMKCLSVSLILFHVLSLFFFLRDMKKSKNKRTDILLFKPKAGLYSSKSANVKIERKKKKGVVVVLMCKIMK